MGSTLPLNEILTLLLPWLLLLFFFFFFLIRPQLLQEKQRKELIKKLKKGDYVVTLSGILGEVVHLEEDTVSLKVADKVVIKVLKSSISSKRGEVTQKKK